MTPSIICASQTLSLCSRLSECRMILEELCPVVRISPYLGLAEFTMRFYRMAFLNYYGKPNDFFGVFFVFLIRKLLDLSMIFAIYANCTQLRG